MLASLCVLAGLSTCVPARWPSGDPNSLGLLEGAAINALLLERANWNTAFVERAAKSHIATFGVIHPGADCRELARVAARLKLNGLVLEGDFPEAAGEEAAQAELPVIELQNRGRIPLDKRNTVVGTAEALWPGVEIEHGGKVSTGPSSAPWINTNTGFLRYLSAATTASIWMGEQPPRGNVFPVQRYALAIADAAITNARWIVSLDEDLEKRLLTKEARALKDWKTINDYIRHFEDHPQWRTYPQFSEFAVVENASTGGLLSAGLLDLLSILHKSARPLPTSELNGDRLRDTTVVLNIDAASLDERQRSDLVQFARDGGKVLNPPPGWRFPPPTPGQISPTAKQTDAIQPIWEMTYDATLRKNFGARTFNTSTIIFTLHASPDRKCLLLHLLNYADYAAEDVAVQVLGTWHTARFYSPGEQPIDLAVYPVQDGTGIDVKKIAVLGTLLIE